MYGYYEWLIVYEMSKSVSKWKNVMLIYNQYMKEAHSQVHS